MNTAEKWLCYSPHRINWLLSILIRSQAGCYSECFFPTLFHFCYSITKYPIFYSKKDKSKPKCCSEMKLCLSFPPRWQLTQLTRAFKQFGAFLTILGNFMRQYIENIANLSIKRTPSHSIARAMNQGSPLDCEPDRDWADIRKGYKARETRLKIEEWQRNRHKMKLMQQK